MGGIGDLSRLLAARPALRSLELRDASFEGPLRCTLASLRLIACGDAGLRWLAAAEWPNLEVLENDRMRETLRK